MTTQRLSLINLIVITLFLTACTPLTALPTNVPSPSSGEGEPINTPTPAGEQQNEAVAAARLKLSEDLGLKPEQIELISSEQVDWPDGCLGLASAGEMCIQVITPGWLIILRAEGQEYEFRTDLEGNIVRMKSLALIDYQPGENYPLPVQAAMSKLSEAQGVKLDQIELVSWEPVEWPDSCLGLPAPEEVCAQVITPGWRVILAVGGQQYEFRTNQEGTGVRQPLPSGVLRLQPEQEYPAAVLAALQSLNNSLRVGIEQIEVVSFEEVEWPDACLGLAGPDELCAQVITPGWRVLLSIEGQEYEFHTDQRGSHVRMKEGYLPENSALA